MKQKSFLRRTSSLVLSLLLIGAVIVALIQRQAIYDWVQLRGYTPPTEIAQLATDDTMTNTGRHIFYVYHPELDDSASFASHCGNHGEQTIVLGCYINPTGIFLSNVQDTQLDGVKQVTAAHEMLHAAYDRLSAKEKAHIDDLINQAYANVTDTRIRTTIDTYQKNGADITNELHSILGTEVRDLPPELETYYTRYFSNREQIVSYSEKYEGAFTSLENQSKQIEQQLSSLKTQIQSMEQQASVDQQSLKNDRDSVQTQAQADAYNVRVDTYNAEIKQINQLVSQYNNLLAQYKQLALQQQQLYQALENQPSASQVQ